MIWEWRIDEFAKREQMMLTANLKMAYSLMYGQCTDAKRAKFEAWSNHNTIANKSDMIRLLECIKAVVMFHFQAQQTNPMHGCTTWGQANASYSIYWARISITWHASNIWRLSRTVWMWLNIVEETYVMTQHWSKMLSCETWECWEQGWLILKWIPQSKLQGNNCWHVHFHLAVIGSNTVS